MEKKKKTIPSLVQTPPTISYSYTKTIAGKVNFKQTVKELDFEIGTKTLAVTATNKNSHTNLQDT